MASTNMTAIVYISELPEDSPLTASDADFGAARIKPDDPYAIYARDERYPVFAKQRVTMFSARLTSDAALLPPIWRAAIYCPIDSKLTPTLVAHPRVPYLLYADMPQNQKAFCGAFALADLAPLSHSFEDSGDYWSIGLIQRFDADPAWIKTDVKDAEPAMR